MINALDPELRELANLVRGHDEHRDGRPIEISAEPAVLDPDHRLILVKIDFDFKDEQEKRNVRFRHTVGPNSSAIYRKTRKWWPISAARVSSWRDDPSTAPSHVLGIFHGIAVGVYPLDHSRWYSTDRENRLNRDGIDGGRWVLPTVANPSAQDPIVEKYRGQAVQLPDGEALFRYRVSGVRYWNVD